MARADQTYLNCERVLHMQLLIHVVHAAPKSQVSATCSCNDVAPKSHFCTR